MTQPPGRKVGQRRRRLTSPSSSHQEHLLSLDPRPPLGDAPGSQLTRPAPTGDLGGAPQRASGGRPGTRGYSQLLGLLWATRFDPRSS